MIVCKQPFTTPARRFAVGQAVTPLDIDGPLSFSQWQELGFIVEEEPLPLPAPEPEPAEPAHDE